MTPSLESARHLIDRPDLRRELDRGLAAPLSLIVAPAGSGKTVLLAQWAATRPDLTFARLDLDPADDDPAHLVGKLAAALGLQDDEQSRLRAFLPIGAGALGAALVDEIVPLLAERAPLVLVLDDVHRLTNTRIVADIGRVVDAAPEGVHVVLSTRYDPPIALSRHRLVSAMVELRGGDLAFDAETTAAVVERIAEGAASPTTVQTILDRTEGWAAGVQLTALALRGRPEPERFAASFAGSDRLVADYLSEEVLQALPEERRTLLLRMSALERMSPALVEDVLGVADADALFEELSRESMFLIPLDGPGGWYRFHHLFRELLRYRLRARFPGQERPIKEDAARWHIAHGDIAAAVRCLLTAESWDAAMDVIMARGRDVYERGRTASVAQWLAAIPDDVRRTRPEAELAYAILLGMSGRAAVAEDRLRAVRDAPGATVGLRVVAQSYLAARVQFRANPDLALRDARDAVALLDSDPDMSIPTILGLTHPALLQTLAVISGGRAAFLTGDFPTARDWFDTGLATEGATYSVYRVHILGSIALLDAWTGRLEPARRAADEALDLATETGLLLHPGTADAYLARSLIAIERGDPAAALSSLGEGIVRASANSRWQLAWVGALQRAILGDSELEHPPTSPPSIVADAWDALRARRRRTHPSGATLPSIGEPSAPAGWSRSRAEHVAGLLGARETVLARASLAELAEPDAGWEPRAYVEFLMLRGWLAALDGQRGPAVDVVERGLAVAEEHGLLTVLVEMGPQVGDLVAALPSAATPFRRRLSTALAAAYANAPHRSGPADTLLDPLTDREKELLEHLPTRMSNAELAAHWYVSVNTIKTHMAHIYRKLDVPNRDAAVARARELGLL